MGVRRGSWVYPIIDDADPYGVGSSGPAVQAGSGLTAPGLAEVASWRSATRPTSRFQKRRQLFMQRTLLHGYYKIKLTANSCIPLSSSRNAVSFSFARTRKRFPCRDVRPQSRLFSSWNQSLRHSPNSIRLC